MYEPAETTHIPLNEEDALYTTTFNDISDGQTIALTQPVDNQLQSTSTSEYPSSCDLAVPLEEISPLSKRRFISRQWKRTVKARQTSLVLTSTPNMEKIKSKSKPKDPPEKRRRQITKTLFEEESEGDISPQNVEDDEEDCLCIYPSLVMIGYGA
ncbi:unnamed protein product [Spodoptera exigua]|nr:unnamed protein product [Spodoptera exigua]